MAGVEGLMKTPWRSITVLCFITASASAGNRPNEKRVEGKRAARIYDSLIVPVTEITAHDKSYSVFVKEKDGVKCSALTKGEVRSPGRRAKYGCAIKVLAKLE